MNILVSIGLHPDQTGSLVIKCQRKISTEYMDFLSEAQPKWWQFFKYNKWHKKMLRLMETNGDLFHKADALCLVR